MHFYALRVSCPACASAFLFGGGARNDLTLWRGVVVRCLRCGGLVSTTAAETVDLTSRPASTTAADGERADPHWPLVPRA